MYTWLFTIRLLRNGKNKRIVTFDVQRNDRTTVSSIVINGAFSVSKDEILGQVLHTDKGKKNRGLIHLKGFRKMLLLLSNSISPEGFYMQR